MDFKSLFIFKAHTTFLTRLCHYLLNSKLNRSNLLNSMSLLQFDGNTVAEGMEVLPPDRSTEILVAIEKESGWW